MDKVNHIRTSVQYSTGDQELNSATGIQSTPPDLLSVRRAQHYKGACNLLNQVDFFSHDSEFSFSPLFFVFFSPQRYFLNHK